MSNLIRWIKFQLLKASIRRSDVMVPIIVTSDGFIIDGNNRWQAARELGIEKIPGVILRERLIEVEVSHVKPTCPVTL
jgi:ParB-like chromosome segregation protein Spo0J